ncbi:hypothetical protein ACIB24_10215 [Spongisporangium articulatum]|uniref:Uncharacterized protein n=1 Tax=Spongisporangium articulatum TaxID=3362603 RepID=A0ABW8AM38_9ACTN
MMHTQPLAWLEVLAWIGLGSAFVSAGLITADIARGARQKLWIMNPVYPVTALYWGPVAPPRPRPATGS